MLPQKSFNRLIGRANARAAFFLGFRRDAGLQAGGQANAARPEKYTRRRFQQRGAAIAEQLCQILRRAGLHARRDFFAE